MNREKIRNFAIIAHIDHGKSTLADRILEFTNTLSLRELNAQHLDSMDIEKERGITIKLNAVQIKYKDYVFHLIDTPGHVDFTYEVSRSLAACEGALLLIDATQGIEAQTLANVYLAMDNNLEIIPLINKVDLPLAEPERIKDEVEKVLGFPRSEVIEISAKNGLNIDKVIESIIERIPSPKDKNIEKPLKALVFDSYFDPYKGVVLLVRIFEGQIKVGQDFIFMSTNKNFSVVECGIKNPNIVSKESLSAGEVGWIAGSIRDAKDVSIGDTITLTNNPTTQAFPGYKKLNPVVFTGFYPIDGKDYENLKEALEKISLSDSSLVFEKEASKALGHGFRVGFLGLLHLEVIQERISREFNIGIVATSASVEFKVFKTNKEVEIISNPSLFPDPNYIEKIEEPFIEAQIMTPEKYVGPLMELCQNKRGKYINLEYLSDKRCKLIYELPLVEVIFDFFDQLKSLSKGYASFDYQMIEYRLTKLVKVDILLNGDKIDAFSFVVHQDFAQQRGRETAKRLKEFIPRHNFEIPVQAVIGGKIIARENIKAFRKDVTAKLYGGDQTRKNKLLKKQKAGKQKAKMFGRVKVPQDTFIKVLKTNKDK